MPAFVPVVLNDRETTPVAHTFTPAGIEDNVATAVNTQGVPVGNERLGISLRHTGNRYKAVLKLTAPVVVQETINGVMKPTVVRTAYAEVHLSFSAESTLQERKNLVGMTYAALAPGQAMINSVITNLENIY